MNYVKFWFVFIVFVMMLHPLMAGEGGVQVGPVTADCAAALKEADVLPSGGSARIWLNVPAGKNTDGLSYTITDEGKPLVNPTNFTVTSCGDGYFYGDITLPAGNGSVTLSVIQADGANVGNDTFRLQ